MAHPGLDFIRDDVHAALLERGELTARVHLFPTLTGDVYKRQVQNPARLPFSVTPSVKRSSAVREYRPVVHRLRLPASP